ncbi:DUF6481 family protein [Terrihabitans sp. B22-R8]|uniref:DUF6481 family protein n=1 Tax=Terrihabitans sp. B22-R8 TaxID=3425128 RepID=UPI00403D4D3D
MAKVTDTFADRQSAAAEARKALLDKFKKRPTEDDPEMQKKLAERRAVAEAREKREAEKAAKRAEEQRLIEEQRARERAEREAQLELERQAAEEAAAAEAKAKESSLASMAARVMADEATLKAKRDARYAARKARGRG